MDKAQLPSLGPAAHDDAGLHRRDMLRLGALGLAAAAGLPGLARAQGKLDHVSIVGTLANTTATLQELMRQQGLFQTFGLDAEFVNVADGSKLMGALLSGSSDICMISGFSQVLAAIEKGGKLKLVAAARYLVEDAIYTKKPEIKRLAGPGGPHRRHRLARRAPASHDGGGAAQGGHRRKEGAVRQHRQQRRRVPRRGRRHRRRRHRRSPTSTTTWTSTACTRSRTACCGPRCPNTPIRRATRPTAPSRRSATSWCARSRPTPSSTASSPAPNSKDAFTRARAAVLKKSANEGEAEWNFIQKYKPYALDLMLSEERIRYMQELNVELGLQKKVLPYNQVVDMSLAQEAVKLLG